MLNRLKLREMVCDAVGDDLGEYQRPELPNIPAVWVRDRPLPQRWKVVVADQLSPVIPAFEAVILPQPAPLIQSRNVGHLFAEHRWQLQVTQHDSRQPMDEMINRVFCISPRVRSPVYIAPTDLYLGQITFDIPVNLLHEVA